MFLKNGFRRFRANETEFWLMKSLFIYLLRFTNKEIITEVLDDYCGWFR